jgi:hypothetical protein
MDALKIIPGQDRSLQFRFLAAKLKREKRYREAFKGSRAMITTAEIIMIVGGVMGASIAYHLAKGAWGMRISCSSLLGRVFIGRILYSTKCRVRQEMLRNGKMLSETLLRPGSLKRCLIMR